MAPHALTRIASFAVVALFASACGQTSGSDAKNERVDALEDRLARVEDALGIGPDAAATPDETTTTTEEEVDEGPALTPTSRIDLRGIGPIEGGMTVAEAETASGRTMIHRDFDTFDGFCWGAEITDLPGLGFLIVARDDEPAPSPRLGLIGRVSVYADATDPARDEAARAWQTVSGIRVGDREAKVIDTYGEDRIAVSQHAYDEAGHYLDFVPRSPNDAGFGLRFETDGTVVTAIHAGTAETVGYTEGCA